MTVKRKFSGKSNCSSSFSCKETGEGKDSHKELAHLPVDVVVLLCKIMGEVFPIQLGKLKFLLLVVLVTNPTMGKTKTELTLPATLLLLVLGALVAVAERTFEWDSRV